MDKTQKLKEAEEKKINLSGKEGASNKPLTNAEKLQHAEKAMGLITSQSGETDSAANMAQSAMGGASTGFAMGGPVGAAVGGVVGGAIGLLKARSARKRAAAEANARMQQGLANIYQNKAGQIGRALEGMRSGFTQSLIRNQGGIRL